MPNVMEMRNLRNKPSRNGFDLSTSRLFSARAGEIVPIFCKLVMPGDKVELYPQHFTRTQPLNTAAYSRVREQVNFFKVRFHLLHNQFDTYVTSMFNNSQVASSLNSSKTISEYSPYITQKSLAQVVYNCNKSSTKDELGYQLSFRIVKLLQYLGYGDFTPYLTKDPSLNNDHPNRRLSPFPLLAYQKVYFDYFRYQQWENSSPFAFNINWADFGSEINLLSLSVGGSNSAFSDSMLTLRYANFKKDYFLGVLPSPQYGDSSVIPVVNSSTPSGAVVTNSVTSFPSSLGNNIGTVNSVQLGNSIRQLVSNPSIISLRKAEAIQKLREIQQSGDQDYKAQVEKIFGVSVPDNESQLCEWLGGYDSDIDISEVVNTNLPEGGPDSSYNAYIKGKGTSSSKGKISFESRDFSIIIGVYTAVPQLFYDVDSPRPVNTMVHIDDYPNPVLDRIGMQSVPVIDIKGYGTSLQSDLTYILGYAPRYFQFKTNFDEVLGAFKNSSSSQLRSWVSPFNMFTLSGFSPNYKMFKVDPAILNPIFVSQIGRSDLDDTIEGYWNDEQFLVNMTIGDASVRPLDYDGLPYS